MTYCVYNPDTNKLITISVVKKDTDPTKRKKYAGPSPDVLSN